MRGFGSEPHRSQTLLPLSHSLTSLHLSACRPRALPDGRGGAKPSLSAPGSARSPDLPAGVEGEPIPRCHPQAPRLESTTGGNSQLPPTPPTSPPQHPKSCPVSLCARAGPITENRRGPGAELRRGRALRRDRRDGPSPASSGRVGKVSTCLQALSWKTSENVLLVLTVHFQQGARETNLAAQPSRDCIVPKLFIVVPLV